MPYQVQQIIQGKGMPSCVEKDDTVAKALATMIEHDFSQLPVIQKEENFDAPLGMVTYEGILRGIRNFNAKIDDLKVRDVMVTAPVYSLEEDLFDILDRLKETNAVLITEYRGFGPDLVGIVTSFDTAEYFRNRTEDLMRVEDIELMIKEFIKAAYVDENGDFDEGKLNSAVAQMTAYKKINGSNQKELFFKDLSLGDYINLLLSKETLNFTESALGMKRNFVNELLQGVREIRNALAHFRGDISSEQRDKLKFAAEWLTRCQTEHQARLEKAYTEKILEMFRKKETPEGILSIKEAATVYTVDSLPEVSSTDFAVTESATSGGQYAALADWLQSQPGRIDQVQLTFNQIEKIINTDLPASAHNHRAWWANDAISHSHSQLWLDAGWRTTYINLTEGKVNFSRIREREKAYITFFSKLLDEFKKKSDFSVRDINPDGASWIVIQTVPSNGPSCGSFNFSFSRDKRLRVELYLDLGEKEVTKSVFDKLYAQRDAIEPEVGKIEWERLDNRRASRIALYHEGYILETKSHAELRKWAAESMAKFCGVMSRLVDHAISEVWHG